MSVVPDNPPANAETLLAQFATQANLLGADVVITSRVDLLPDLRSRLSPPDSTVGLSRELLDLLPELGELASGDDLYPHTAITLGFRLIAATGTLLLAESTRGDRALRCAAARHLIIVPADPILPSIADGAAVLSSLLVQDRRYATFVSGPSRTGDIERVLTIGMHGPRELVVVAVRDLVVSLEL